MIEIEIKTLELQQNISRAAQGLEQRGSLMRLIAGRLHQAVDENFNSQGRPAWAGLKLGSQLSRAGALTKRGQVSQARFDKYVRNHKILQKTGRLRNSITEASDNDSARVGNCISLSDYPEAQDYLQGVEIVGQSYRELLPQHIGNPRTLLVLDPPYVCTQQGNYRKAAYFGMVEFLRLMAMVRPPFVFFSSTRSELPAYLDLVAELRLPGWERFAGSQTLTVSSTINRNSSYDDHLIYKF